MADIFIAEDDENIRTLLEMILGADGHMLNFADDGRKALMHLKTHTPDLIILDISMPFVDGLDICRRVKLIDRFNNTPVMILTALDDRNTIETIKVVGADLYLKKPLSGLNLREQVKELLENVTSDQVSESSR